MSNFLTPTFVFPDTDSLAALRSEATNDPYLAWYHAIATGRSIASIALIDPDAFLALVNTASQPSQLSVVLNGLSEYAELNPYSSNAFNYLNFYIEHSPYSLGCWLQGIEFFYDWLAEHGKRAKFSAVIEYMNATIEQAAEDESLMGLSMLLESALSAHGFDS